MYRPSSRKSSRIGKDVDKSRKQRFKGEYMMVNLHEWELTERAKKQGWEEGHTAGRLEGIEAGKIEGKIEGEKYGAEQKAIETAKKLLLEGLSAEQIARCTNLSLEKVLELKIS